MATLNGASAPIAQIVSVAPGGGGRGECLKHLKSWDKDWGALESEDGGWES